MRWTNTKTEAVYGARIGEHLERPIHRFNPLERALAFTRRMSATTSGTGFFDLTNSNCAM